MKAIKYKSNQNFLKLFFLLIFLVMVLGDPLPASATTPVTGNYGIKKPDALVLWTPWGPGIQAKIGGGNTYGQGGHLPSVNQYYAIDFNLDPEGGEIYPVRQGNVVFAEWLGGGFGNTVIIRHDIGDAHKFYYYSVYAHLANGSIKVAGHRNNPPNVNRNQVLGREGNTGGTSNGIHLHFFLVRCAKDFNIWNGSYPLNLINDTSNCKSVVPEPLIGAQVYEGFGLLDGKMDNIKLIGANPGTDNPSGPPTAEWGNSTNQSLTTIYPGNKINFSVENLPSDVKEVRLTAYYPNWSNGKLGDWEDNIWRILARCTVNIQPPNSNCGWLDIGQNKTLSYQWDPYSELEEPSRLYFDADWWPSNPTYLRPTTDWVCISFDVFDNAGNVTYAPAGVQCDFGGVGLNTAGKYLLAPAQNTTSSARLIYISQSSTPAESVLPTGSWISPSNGQSFSSSTVTLNVNASDNVGGSGVREVRWAAKYDGKWYGIGTDNSAPYSINWNWCTSGVPNRTNEDVEIGFEVWDNAGNKWVYSEHGNVNIHIYKNHNCEPQGGVNWSVNFYNNDKTHWWDPNDSGGFTCNRTFNQGNLDKNYGDGSPCDNGVVNNWVGDYIGTGHFDAGNYAFWVSHDDWLKLFIDGQEVYSVNGVHTQWVCPGGAYKNFSAGNHQLRAILYEDGGQARVKVEWAKNTTVCDPPGNFSKISPETLSEDSSTSRTLSWNPASGTLKYSYCIDTVNNNACNGDWQNVEASTSVTLNNLLPNTTYYWQVNAYSVGGVGTPADGGTWWSFTTQDPPPSHNLLMNSSFEEGDNNPTWWSKGGWHMPYSNYTWDSTVAHWGVRSVKISNNTANDAYWSQNIQVQPNSTYRLSGWIKTENVSNTSEINNHGAHLSTYGFWTYSTGFFGTNDWSYVSYLINTGSNTNIIVTARIGTYSGTATGTAWFDDLKLELLSTPTCYSLTKNITPTGSGNIDVYPLPNCNNGTQYIHGTTVAVNALTNSGYSFSGWNEDAIGIDSVAYVTMTGNKSVSTNFAKTCYSLILTYTGNGSAPIANPLNSNGCPSQQYHAGEIITLTANPANKWEVGSWTATDNDSSTSITNTLTMPPQTFGIAVNYRAIKTYPTLSAPRIPRSMFRLLTNNATPTLSWLQVHGAFEYEITLATDRAFSNIVLTETSPTTSFTPTTFLPDGVYYWKICALNEILQPGKFSIVQTLTIDTTPPAIPTLTSPMDGAELKRSPILHWTRVSGGVIYELQVSTSSDFSNPTTYTLRTNSRNLPALPDDVYYWRVRAKDSAGNWSDWSVHREFEIDR
jgi:hypothetical protein